MPVLRGSVSFSRFAVEPLEGGVFDAKKKLSRALKARAFEPLDKRSDEDRAVGFVELENPDAVEFSAGALYRGEWALFGYRVDTLRVSAAELRAELERWQVAFEREQGRPPRRAEKTEAKAAVRQKLRARAVPSTRVHDVSWALKSAQLQVWAGSRKAVEEVQLAMEAAFGVRLRPLTPATEARRRQPDKELSPTLELVGVEAARGGDHGQA